MQRKTGVDSATIKTGLNKLLMINRDHASALALRADINREAGHYQAAINDYQRAHQQTPHDQAYLNNLAYSLMARL